MSEPPTGSAGGGRAGLVSIGPISPVSASVTASQPAPKASRLGFDALAARAGSSPRTPRARKGSDAGAGERAEQARRDDAAVRVGDALHVEGDEALRPLARDRGDLRAIGDRLARRRLLEDAVGAVRGGDERRAVGGDQPALDGAARLHHLGRDDDVDIARRRHHGKDRHAAAVRDHLEIVDRGAGPLRDTRARRSPARTSRSARRARSASR